MFLIGDCHGLYKEYLELRGILDQSLLLGDIGLGFGNKTVEDAIEAIPNDPNHRLLRGNHDNPIIFQKHPSSIPVWGYDEKMDMFWLGGGFSIDREYRTPGWDWWSNEEIGYEILGTEVYPKYVDTKPRIVISHECPGMAQARMFPDTTKRHIQNRTKTIMNQMFEIHQPDLWIFGHYHEKRTCRHDNTLFVCCGMLNKGVLPNKQKIVATYEIKGLEWSF